MPVVRIIAIVFFLGLAVGINVLCYRRAAEVFRLGVRTRRTLAATLLLSVVAILVGRWIGGEGLARSVAVLGWAVQGSVLISTGLLLPLETARLFVGLVRKLRGLWHRLRGFVGQPPTRVEVAADEVVKSEQPAKPATMGGDEAVTDTPPSRREFLYRAAAGGALLVGSGASVYGTFVGSRDFVIEERVFALRGLPRALEGYTLVQLSDLHFGPFVGQKELVRMVELVAEAQPDAVVITGDVIDSNPAVGPLVGSLVSQLREFTRDGVFVIPGNHDYYAGVQELVLQVTRAGGQMLTNASTLLGDRGGQFALAGVDDVWAYRYSSRPGPDIEKALRGIPTDMTKVLLCHNPSYFPHAAPHVDLQLSGHTHGGQISLFINPAELVLPHGFVRDAYRLGDASLYVNRGFGTTGPPCRVGSAPEITKLVLTSA